MGCHFKQWTWQNTWLPPFILPPKAKVVELDVFYKTLLLIKPCPPNETLSIPQGLPLFTYCFQSPWKFPSSSHSLRGEKEWSSPMPHRTLLRRGKRQSWSCMERVATKDLASKSLLWESNGMNKAWRTLREKLVNGQGKKGWWTRVRSCSFL